MRSCRKCRVDYLSSHLVKDHVCPICSGVSVSGGEIETFPDRTSGEIVETALHVRRLLNWGSSLDEIIRDLAISKHEMTLSVYISEMNLEQQCHLAESGMSGEVMYNLMLDGKLKKAKVADVA